MSTTPQTLHTYQRVAPYDSQKISSPIPTIAKKRKMPLKSTFSYNLLRSIPRLGDIAAIGETTRSLTEGVLVSREPAITTRYQTICNGSVFRIYRLAVL